jgi:DNA-binding IclR family transcriptional regulator
MGRRSALESELREVRRRGYATSDEEGEDGVCSVAVAYPPRQSPVRLALNVTVPVYRMNGELAGRLAAALKAAVAESAGLLH